MSNKELQEKLMQYPSNAEVVVEYCNPDSIHYDKDRNMVIIN